ncbi:Acyl-CoA dehydrogenase [Candidatus Izimaplasma bacterium HR1]|jgi:butyryl-CoA dehydrogenase|uniref:acyl-CoA dehydrogenase n=1 Tax=Candidatus Izimoplasma sp. HR1 TaxID=1541959 RepID=UPI0004F71D29|nr:Acyl-CoA dehydrogenase [Candidatus Izimaplasma bacterium HR1]
MDFLLDERHLLLRKLFREFSINDVKPLAKEVDELERFPLETVEKMKELRMFGISVAKEFSGSGADYLSYILAIIELSKQCATTGVILSAHTSLCVDPIAKFGSKDQKERYLHKLATGEYLGAFALTEPDAGTDASSQKTTAIDKGDFYEITGSKIFITNAGYADVYIIFALTEPSLGTKGISAFIIEKDMPGFTIGKKELKMGIKGSATCELHFEKVKVSKENLLGKLNKGFGVALTTLDGGRIGIAAQAIGIALGAIDETVKYVKERKQFGRSISKFQNTQFVLADLRTKTEAAYLLVLRAAILKQEGKPFSKESAMAKLNAAEVAMEVTTKCLQLFGGYGYTREYPIERMMRDAKITEIYEGTSEVQKMVISSYMLK